MIWLPFVCLTVGVVIGLQKQSGRIMKYVDLIINTGLVVLMLTLGAKIGGNETLIGSLGILGFHCLVIALCAIMGSILFTLILERTVLPLREIRMKPLREGFTAAEEAGSEDDVESRRSPLVWIMPGCIVAGIVAGLWILPDKSSFILDRALTFSLVVLYIGVGISFGVKKYVFEYLRILSWRIILLPAAVVLGSLLGGGIAGFLLDLPVHTSVYAAAGMSYYSITGAVLTQVYGIEAGVYGFLVNVAREFLTVLLLPGLIRISPGSPIASGAAGNMDTMLVPVTKFVGVELGIVTLITGTVLTILVPVLLSLLVQF